MKRFRDIFIGVLIGCMVMATPVLAESVLTKIDVVLNGVNVQLEGADVQVDSILYNGTTYLPMRKVAELVGKDIEWKQETKTANITKKTNFEEGDKVIENEKINTDNGIVLNGIEYYRYDYVRTLIEGSSNENYSIYNSSVDTDVIKLTFSKFTGSAGKNEEILIESVPFEMNDNRIFISKDYYENTILPLIK